jgi:alanine or glycine:cation symporter, AGCS family
MPIHLPTLLRRPFWLVASLLALANLQAQDPAPPQPTPAAVLETTVVAVPKKEIGLDEKIDKAFAPVSEAISNVVFAKIPVGTDLKGEPMKAPFVIFWLGLGGLFLTIFFKFINLTGLKTAYNTVRMKYSRSDDPGEITHFQALSAALSGTVGLGNIAGVAIGISAGGPGAAFWLFVTGFIGMTTKFCECVLGVRYREIENGKVYGGSFYTLKKGLAEIGLAPVGKVMAVFFAICCVGGAFGGGNMFQVNQAFEQLVGITGGATSWWAGKGAVFGLIIAVLTGLTIIGGIQSISRVTDKLTPVMCLLYFASAGYVLLVNFGKLPAAIGIIMEDAFTGKAVGGGFLGALIWGIRRAAFSNEAGFGSSPIAHAAVKTRHPASEGYVALLEPFMDTVVICTMTALVIVVTGSYGSLNAGSSTSQAIQITSNAFASAGSVFPYILFLSVLCFAVSTLISWSYYGQQAWAFLFGRSRNVELIYKVIFCGFIIVGAAAKLGSVVDFSDAMMFAMCFPNFIGIYLFLPKIKEEIAKFAEHRRQVDAGK